MDYRALAGVATILGIGQLGQNSRNRNLPRLAAAGGWTQPKARQPLSKRRSCGP
jgi:hypothetical protein